MVQEDNVEQDDEQVAYLMFPNWEARYDMWIVSLESIAIEEVWPTIPVLSIVRLFQEDACEQTAEHVAYFRSLKDVS